MGQKHVAVIGGAGFIGSHLADALVGREYRVRIIDNLDPQVHPGGAWPSYLNPKVERVAQDVRDMNSLREALEGVEAIFYLAGAIGVGDSMYRIRHYAEANVAGAANVLEILADRKDRVKKIVLASSVTVYGEGKYVCPTHGVVGAAKRSGEQIARQIWDPVCPIPENGRHCERELTAAATDEAKPAAPLSIYAVTKRTQEEMFLVFGHTYGIEVTVLRYFNVYGSRQAISNPYTGVAKIFAMEIANGRAPLVYEDGEQSRDFVHVSDVVQANLAALDREEANGEIFNVGSGRRTSVLELAHAIARRSSGKVKIEASGQHRAGDVRHCWADISKIRKKLGYEPKTIFPAGLEDLPSMAESGDATGSSVSHREMAQRGLIS